jgi:hypothetical protein
MGIKNDRNQNEIQRKHFDIFTHVGTADKTMNQTHETFYAFGMIDCRDRVSIVTLLGYRLNMQ